MRRHGMRGAIAALVLALLLPVPAATAATTAGCADQSGQLVANCGFETGDWSSWTPQYNTSSAAVVGASDGVTPYAGSWMLGAASTDGGLLTQILATTPGTWYTASLRWMGGHATSTDVWFQAAVQNGPSSSVTIASIHGAGYSSEWAERKISFQALAASSELSLMWVNGPGRYYIDEISVVPASPPAAPTITGLTAYAHLPGEVIVSWSPPASQAGMPPLTGFNVYVRPSDGSYGSTPANGSTPVWQSYDVTGLTDGTEYCFVVKAINGAGEGAASAEGCKTPIGLPTAPALTSLEPGPGSMTLHWTAPAWAGQGISRYDFTSALWDGSACGAFNDTAHVLTSNPAATSATLTGWPAGQEYCFVIWAVDTNTYPGARSNILHAAADAIPTTVTIAGPAQAVAGAKVTYTATVSPSSATGKVDFLDGGTPIPGCTAQSVAWGSTSCEVTYASPGTHDVTAQLTAGSGYLDSTSATAAQTLVTYGVSVLTPGVRVVPGWTATFRIQLVDAAGANLSTSGIAVTVTGVSPSLGTTVDGTMTFVPAAHKKPAFYTYRLAVPASATVGEYRLSFTASGDPVTHQDLVFTVATKRK